MKLSIIIPLYNKEKYIERCLRSLMDQNMSFNEYEIIIIDDGSMDSGGSIVQNYSEKYPNINLYIQENQGVSAARNKGLELSKGDYVYFLDADDYIANNVLNGIIELCEKNSLEILEFSSKEVKEGVLTDTTSKTFENETVDVKDGLLFIAEHNFRTQAWRYIVQRRLLMETGIKFMNGTLYEDVLFTVSLFLKATRMAKVNIDVHRYVVVPDSINTTKNQSHHQKMTNSIIIVVDQIQLLIGNLDCSNLNYDKVVSRLKARQQAMVFSLMLRTFRHRIFDVKDLKKVLVYFNDLGIYPMDPKIGGGIQKGKSRIVLPIMNNKTLLFLALRVKRLVPSNYSF